jgi:Fic family protein
MSLFKNVDLEFENGRHIHFNEDYLMPFCEELLDVIDGEDYMRNLSFAKKMMMGQEIKSNNTIEGICDDLSLIDEVIKTKSSILDSERKRIINLYHGYQYVLTHKDINKENLRELYSLLSAGLLEARDRNNMGKYYRNGPVYILKGIHIGDDMFMGMDSDKLSYYMDQFFDYVNSDNSKSEIDIFLKSQIMHFYFVYLHPYFDVNGRTSRTVSMWYLLNNKSYPYIIFNQAIAFARQDYEENIIKGRSHGDVTLFLKYMLVRVEYELEKQYVIHSIIQNTLESLSKDELQMINYILTMRGNLTAKDLASFYNRFNSSKRPSVIYEDKIVPLIEKEIILDKGCTNGYIKGNKHNINIGLNPDKIRVESSKVKHLSLNRFM